MSPNAGAWRVHVWRSPVSWRSSCTGYGLPAPSSVGPNKPQRRYPLHDKRSSSSRLTRAEPRRSRGDDGRGDLAECPEPEGSNAPKVAGQIGTRRFSPFILQRPKRRPRQETRKLVEWLEARATA